jgi:hypothetical protein
MIDLAHLTDTPQLDDFTFYVGTSEDLSAYTAAPAPDAIAFRPGAGSGGSDRVSFAWGDHAIENQWLLVTVLADDHGGSLGFAEDQAFLFASLIGETGNVLSEARADTSDIDLIRGNFTPDASVINPYDLNRDGVVNQDDVAAAEAQPQPTSLSLLWLPMTATSAPGTAAGWAAADSFDRTSPRERAGDVASSQRSRLGGSSNPALPQSADSESALWPVEGYAAPRSVNPTLTSAMRLLGLDDPNYLPGDDQPIWAETADLHVESKV